MRHWMAPALLLVAGAASALGWYGGQALRLHAGQFAEGRVAVVEVSRALQAHPRWPELAFLRVQAEQEERAQEAHAAAVREAEARAEERARRVQEAAQQELSLLREQGRLGLEQWRQQLQVELASREAQLWSRVQAQVEARRQEMEVELEQEASLRRWQLKAELQKYQEEVNRAAAVQLLNLQLRLALADLQEQERERLQKEVEALRRQLQEKVEQKERALEEEYRSWWKEQSEAQEKDLRSYADRLQARAREELERERRRLEAELAEEEERREEVWGQAAPAPLAGPLYSPAPEQVGPAPWSRRAAALEAELRADVKAAAAQAARRRKLSCVLGSPVAARGALDITGEVMGILAAGRP
ncbi:MAG: hypothetical protein QJR13_00070 [Bacillota bacterium]|nr:hypothetical protein [Bacillota bacterium]